MSEEGGGGGRVYTGGLWPVSFSSNIVSVTHLAMQLYM